VIGPSVWIAIDPDEGLSAPCRGNLGNFCTRQLLPINFQQSNQIVFLLSPGQSLTNNT
jgi:hypothetical protein